jgi:hypothetical protein
MINTPIPTDDLYHPDAEYQPPLSESARRGTGTNILIAIGIGLAVGAVVHALRPAPKPQHRLARLLEDMEETLREVSAPALNRVGALASDGAQAVGARVHRGEAQVEKFIRDAARRLRRFVP